MIPLLEKAGQLPLTETEREILAWLQEHPAECISMDLQTLAGRLYTSSATIVRFCHKLGLGGFNEFKYQLRSELRTLQQPVFSPYDLMGRSLALFRDNIDGMDYAALEQAAAYLICGRPVYLFGSDLSSIPAHYLHSILTTLDYPCILISWINMLRGLSMKIDPEAIVFIITAHGDPQRYLSVFENLKKRGADSVLITCESQSPLIHYSSISLCANDRNCAYQHVDINPRIGIFTIVQALIELILLRHDQDQQL